jgi:CubicO group peptidase (beta-lactamase class C family)
MRRPHCALPTLALVLRLLIISAHGESQAQVDAVPAKINDQWETAAPSEEKLAPDLIRAMLTSIINDGKSSIDGSVPDEPYRNISSVLIVKNGKLVVEEYFPRGKDDRREQAFRRVTPHEQTSATKSVTSILVGIAIDRKLIKDVDEKISTLLPEYADVLAASDKGKIRLKDLLTMQAGLSWDEWTLPYTDARNDHIRMLRSDDPIRYVLEQPVVAPAGTKFVYSSGISIVLGKIIAKASGQRVDKFAEQNLFEPLGISDFYWSKYPDEIVQTGGGLFLRPRDMAKLGQLFLNGGQWKGKQILSEKWVEESTKGWVGATEIPKAARADGYGYHWWVSSFKVGDQVVNSFSARGRGGQFILVLPKQQVVAVFTSPVDNASMFQPLDMVQKYILPAAVQK